MTTPGFLEVAISLVLVVIAIVIARYWRIPVEKDMALGSVRAFAQLVAVGYALEFIFDLESPWLIILALVIMIVVGAHAASGRVKGIRRPFVITVSAMAVGSFVTIGVMVLARIISFEARYIIPLGGMIIGNSMNASALTADRLSSDLRSQRLAIESALALGKGWRVASAKFIRNSATAGMMSMLNFMKTVGIVALPGAMTGMILAGAEPLDAVLLQIIVAYMLLSAVTITSIMAVELTVRRFFTRCHQLQHDV
ncbi:MAG: iron export ABC transporter permease subunit FetB [Candidatus Zixiibacteriota bacterium]|nr:MAG: iron export ABC transporter permease subunit FetB [candidate division Zixibacteria bacterium]